MATNETKNGRKFLKMYDPETGEYLGPKEIENATKNSAEIFCRITYCTYDTFNRYVSNYWISIPTLLPNIVKSSITTISCC